jgi:NAD(P)H-nitrite reductase large subunit
VIGNGVAGNAACTAIRSRNKEVKLTLLSEEPHPLYSACVLNYYIAKEIDRPEVFLKNLGDYEREGITLLLGRKVERIDPSTRKVFIPGRELAYEKLILATGSQPIIPSVEGTQKEGVRVLKSLGDADDLYAAVGKKAIIVGSGPIGVELAVALRKRGWAVVLIEALDWILPNLFNERGSSIVRGILERQGIRVLTSERVLAIEGKASVEQIVTQSGGREKGDMVVFTTGMRPSVDLAQEAGIVIGELGGIRTNDEMETSVKDIYACGDCVEGRDPFALKPALSLLWPHAERQGTVAGLNSIGEHRSHRWLPDVINLDIFGTFAGAMGQPAKASGRTEIEVLEKEEKGRYCCVVISAGRLAGAQFIGQYEGMGVLFALMGRDYEQISFQVKNEEGRIPFFWYNPARYFFDGGVALRDRRVIRSDICP